MSSGGAVFEEFGLVLILLAGLAQLLSCSRVPIIAILTLDFLECHVKRHEEPVKGPRGLTVACIRLWPEFDPSKRLRIILVGQIGTHKPERNVFLNSVKKKKCLDSTSLSNFL